MRFPRLDGPERTAHDLFINSSQFIACAGKEARDHCEAVPDSRGAGWSQGKNLTTIRKTVESFGMCTLTAHGPQRIAEMLFDQWYPRPIRHLKLQRVAPPPLSHTLQPQRHAPAREYGESGRVTV